MKQLQTYKSEAKKEIFRLEFFALYNVPADLEEFEKWRRGEPTAADDPNNTYWQEVREAHERGVDVRRVRVVDFPVSEYLRYEIDFYRGSIEAGEEILFIERVAAIECMQSSVVSDDFWLFDRNTVLLWLYDADFDHVGQQEIEGDTERTSYTKLRDCLIENALPMSEFMSRYPDSFSAATSALHG